MKTKHRRTLEAIFRRPTEGGIAFGAIEALIVALGGEVREGEGSRVAFELNGTGGIFTGHIRTRKPGSTKLKRFGSG